MVFLIRLELADPAAWVADGEKELVRLGEHSGEDSTLDVDARRGFLLAFAMQSVNAASFI